MLCQTNIEAKKVGKKLSVIGCSIELLAMPEPTNFSGPTGPRDPMFREHPRTTRLSPAMVAILAVAAAVIIGLLLIAERHNPAPVGNAAYAANLELSNLQVSQSESLAGARSTFVEGRIVNHGNETVTAATVEAQFASGGGEPQVLNSPLGIIHMRQPYVDTRPLSALPLGPGQQADFRLVYEGVNDSWNQQPPSLHIVQVSTR
jgi:hypothetical protein